MNELIYSNASLGISLAPQREQDTPIVHQDFLTLPDTVQVKCAIFDEQGHLWGCGDGGVIRWLITPTKTSYRIWHLEHGIADNDALCIAQYKGNIYVGHHSGNISIYNPSDKTWSIQQTKLYQPIRVFSIIDSHFVALTDVGIYFTMQERLVSSPYPINGHAHGFDEEWFSTPQGLLHFADGVFTLQEQYPFHSLKQISFEKAHQRLWMIHANGVGYLTSDKRYHPNQLKSANYLTHTPQGTLISTPKAIIESQQLQPIIQEPNVVYIVKNEQSFVLVTPQKISYLTQGASPREITPTLSNSPQNVYRQLTLEAKTWVQTCDNALWQYSPEKGWKPINYSAPKGGISIACTVLFHGKTLFGCDSKYGLATWDETSFTTSDTLQYVIQLKTQGDFLEAQTASGTRHRSQDGILWKEI